jgi:basic membrane lipoprotein Med (substrate-binding protein (PBP1-ABC) superfamily)
MAQNLKSISGREYSKFVESPSRPGESAIEVVDNQSKDVLDDILVALGGSGSNTLQKILSAQDRVQQIVYADFGNKNQRVTQINYTASSVGIQTAQKIFSYSLVGNRYRRDTITWNII